VFERFTERARQVVVLAQEEARILKHNYIGTEHILLGLLREEEGLAARVLESLDRSRKERPAAAGVSAITGGRKYMSLLSRERITTALACCRQRSSVVTIVGVAQSGASCVRRRRSA